MLESVLSRFSWEQLDRSDYLRSYARVRDSEVGPSLKLECAQSFSEPGFDSYRAFVGGDLSGALSMARHSVESSGISDQAAIRVRVVDDELTPYLEWELHVLEMKLDFGEDIRVLNSNAAYGLLGESLPELLLVGDRTMWQPLYGADGVNIGALEARGQPTSEPREMAMKAFEAGIPLREWMAANQSRFNLKWPTNA